MLAELKVVQVGYGYWGANLTKKLLESSKFDLAALCEVIPERREKASGALPDSVIICDNYTQFLSDESITGFVIATQTELSFDIAVAAMNAGKHIFIEKPIASTVDRTTKLGAIAAEKGVILHCDHILLYNPYCIYIKNMIDNGELGDLIYVDVAKLNLGPIRMDVNALMDLAVHDVAVIDWISNGKYPQSVSAFGHVSVGKQETLTFLNIKYDSFIAHIASSWISPIKVRQTVIAGTKKMVVFDDMSHEKIRIYDCGIDVIPKKEYLEYAFLTRKGDIHMPNIEFEDSLLNSLEYFWQCISTGRQSLSGPESSLRVMRVLEWAQNELNKDDNRKGG
jgi:predicted dehydrogenase